MEEYIPGKLGIQPHNFVIKDGVQIPVKLYDPYSAPNNNFEWLTSQRNYRIEVKKSYMSTKKDTKSKVSTLVFKTSGADASIILVNDFIQAKKNEITTAFFVPFTNQNKKINKLAKILNFKTGFCSL